MLIRTIINYTKTLDIQQCRFFYYNLNSKTNKKKIIPTQQNSGTISTEEIIKGVFEKAHKMSFNLRGSPDQNLEGALATLIKQPCNNHEIDNRANLEKLAKAGNAAAQAALNNLRKWEQGK